MRKHVLRLMILLLVLAAAAAHAQILVDAAKWPIREDGWYSSMEEVSVYLDRYARLPENYLTKAEARNLGWGSLYRNVGDAAQGMSIGGDRYGNYEGLLPEASGRRWTECDIDYAGEKRNGKRIVFSNDGLIYYTQDHYSTFEEVRVENQDGKAAGGKPAKDSGSQEDGHGMKIRYTQSQVEEWEHYTAWQDVSAYLMTYGHLPENYMTMEEARELGFSSKKDNMNQVAWGYGIGGGRYENREGLLPAGQWLQCDVDMKNGKRGNHRLVWNEEKVYLSEDRLKSFVEIRRKEP